MLHDSSNTDDFRAAARAIVELRTAYEHKDMPDWTGRSSEYRDAIERLYEQAEVPPDSESSVQSKIRYHVGNIVREVAPVEQLHALGLKPKGPADRRKETRSHEVLVPAAARNLRVDNPIMLAALAKDAVTLLCAVDTPPEDKQVVQKVVREIIDACAEYLSS